MERLVKELSSLISLSVDGSLLAIFILLELSFIVGKTMELHFQSSAALTEGQRLLQSAREAQECTSLFLDL